MRWFRLTPYRVPGTHRAELNKHLSAVLISAHTNSVSAGFQLRRPSTQQTYTWLQCKANSPNVRASSPLCFDLHLLYIQLERLVDTNDIVSLTTSVVLTVPDMWQYPNHIFSLIPDPDQNMEDTPFISVVAYSVYIHFSRPIYLFIYLFTFWSPTGQWTH